MTWNISGVMCCQSWTAPWNHQACMMSPDSAVLLIIWRSSNHLLHQMVLSNPKYQTGIANISGLYADYLKIQYANMSTSLVYFQSHGV